jgi:hypothetical protein
MVLKRNRSFIESMRGAGAPFADESLAIRLAAALSVKFVSCAALSLSTVWAEALHDIISSNNRTAPVR